MSRTTKPENFYRQSKLVGEQVVSKPVTLQLPPAHPSQYDLISIFDKHPEVRFVVGACGTKWGKTWGCATAIVRHAWLNPNSLSWWIAPIFAQSKNAYNMIKRLLPPGTFIEYKADLRLVLLQPDGTERSSIEFKSADNPDSLRGFGVNFFVMDEAARAPEESYISLLTTVTQTMGKGILISTPKGRGWFWTVYGYGEKYFEDGTPKFGPDHEDDHPEWRSLRLPTWSNPHVKLEAIRVMKRNLVDDAFRQEVAAQFLVDSAGVFRGINACIRGDLQEPIKGQRYVIGVDLGRLKDFSVLVTMNAETRHVVAFQRFNKLEWAVQYHRITEEAKKYNRALLIMDSTGIGDPIVEAIQAAGARVDPYKISGPIAKQQLVDTLRIAIEKGTISFPPINVLRKELESFEYEISDTGKIKYSAGQGHDDAVIALALAVQGLDSHNWKYRYSSMRGI